MATAGVQDAYATISQSDSYLPLKDDWLDADDEVKEDALLWGRYYIDANFDCVIDYDNIDEEVVFANSLLGYDYLSQGDLFFDNQDNLILKRVKAGSVETEKEYASGTRKRPNSLSKVISILSSICNNTSGRLVRV